MRVRLILAALLSLVCLACSASERQRHGAPPRSDEPLRIVSLDYCADQYVLKFAKRENILALSIDSEKRFSYLRDQAQGLGKVRPRTAEVLALEPDLVVRSYGGGPNVSAFMERAGVPVLQIGFPQNIAEVRREVLRMGEALGAPEEARKVAEDMDLRLAAIARQTNGKPEALYMTPGGVTAGEGTLIDELFAAAGIENFQSAPGWQAIPLERLAYKRPELVVAAFFESQSNDIHNWAATRHPVAQAQLRELPVAEVDGAWTSCGGWFLVEAVEAMARTGAAKR